MVQTMPAIKATFSDKDMEDLMEAHAAEKIQSQPSTLGRQFTPFTGGPEEARSAYKAHLIESTRNRPGWPKLEEDKPEGPTQGSLFDKESIPRPEAHHQTPQEFAADTRTWWHGRVTKGGPKGSLGGSTVGRGEGFHAGSEAAARQRVTHNVRRRGVKEGMAGHMYPLRITGPVEGPEHMREDTSKHIMLGPARSRWGSRVGGLGHGYLYEQAVESPGSISVGVPSRKGFLSTHREMVKSVAAQGQYVHPNIQWAVSKGPEHTEEEIKSREYTKPAHEQMGLEQQWERGSPEWKSAYTQLRPEHQHGDRVHYVTEGGKRKSAWANFTAQPGSALLGKQWMPAN